MESFAVIELKSVEMVAIDGGKPLGYYLGFAAGAIAGTTISFIAGLIGGLEDKHL